MSELDTFHSLCSLGPCYRQGKLRLLMFKGQSPGLLAPGLSSVRHARTEARSTAGLGSSRRAGSPVSSVADPLPVRVLVGVSAELVYDDVFSVWETIWAARHVSSAHYVLFIALALVEVYRDIILENNMDFTDIIKFFNEMAERHNTKQVLKLARDLVYKVQTLIENK
ncbi:small G protein signaling modulator 1 [Phyllostomus discolor]|uniref:Small G protein signaling modulator 1 n=1 Tax=Phyllostomus discolor TaxID=89673 RepID=A0A834DK69_9CHIR|nr:small G protein signaling modulator 1 [Phyllostomus discolor]